MLPSSDSPTSKQAVLLDPIAQALILPCRYHPLRMSSFVDCPSQILIRSEGYLAKLQQHRPSDRSVMRLISANDVLCRAEYETDRDVIKIKQRSSMVPPKTKPSSNNRDVIKLQITMIDIVKMPKVTI